MAQICDRLGVDVWEVIDAAATKPFGYMKFTPGPGLGGHCIPLDPHYLAWKMRTLHYKTRMIGVADEINSEMPAFSVSKVAGRPERSRGGGEGGEGPRARRGVQEGHRRHARVAGARRDPAARGPGSERRLPRPAHSRSSARTGTSRKAVELTDEELASADAVMIITDHSGIDYQRIVAKSKLVVDTRNATAGMVRSGGAKSPDKAAPCPQFSDNRCHCDR